MPKIFEQVYYVEASNGGYANPVAIRPGIYEDRVEWEDTSKGKIVYLGKINDLNQTGNTPPDLIEITSNDGRFYRLQKLTNHLYENNVRAKVAFTPSFSSDDELRKFYLTKNFEIY